LQYSDNKCIYLFETPYLYLPFLFCSQIFASHGQRIVGITKKGQDFFKLASSLTETIYSIVVEDTRIWTGCEYVYNLYDNGKDSAFFISPDRINDVIVANVTRDTNFDAVLACQDSRIRIIRESLLFLEIPTANPVVTLSFTNIEKDVKSSKAPTGLLYAMENGALAFVQVAATGTYGHIWNIDDGVKRSPITCMRYFDINKDGVDEILVGRDDGRVEIYRQDNPMALPVKVFSKDVGESIRSIECGYVNSTDFLEVSIFSVVVVSTTTHF
jgi:Bardet-Biedl syndrome 7 protein